MNPQNTKPPTVILAFIGLAAVALFFFGLLTDHYWLRMVTKPLPVLCIALWIFLGRRGKFGHLVVLGLLLSAIGDILLEYGEHTFLAGVLAFLFAHIFYTGAFLSRTRALKPLHAIPFVAWGLLVYVLLHPTLGEMAVTVAFYIIVICTMMWRAAAHMGSGVASTSDERAGALGAISFGLSDTLIALNRWYAPIPEARYFIMVLYWLGQLGIGLSTRVKKS